MRALLAPALVALVLVAAQAAPADPAPGAAPTPVITISAIQPHPPTVTDCTGQKIPVGEAPATIVISVHGDLTSAILVHLSYDATFAAPTPAALSLRAGSTGRSFEMSTSDTGTVKVTIGAGSGYSVGTPASATINFGQGLPSRLTCTRSTERKSTVVGSRPSPATGTYQPGSYEGKSEKVIGKLPPGLSIDGFTGIFSGRATTPGTYTQTYFFGDADIYFSQLDLIITVLPQATPTTTTTPPSTEPTSPPTAAPAQPVTTKAQFTG